MFGSLAWTQILMNAQYECWIVKSPIPTSDITQETVADRFPWGIPEVAKLSIPVLNLSIGPVPSDRFPEEEQEGRWNKRGFAN